MCIPGRTFLNFWKYWQLSIYSTKYLSILTMRTMIGSMEEDYIYIQLDIYLSIMLLSILYIYARMSTMTGSMEEGYIYIQLDIYLSIYSIYMLECAQWLAPWRKIISHYQKSLEIYRIISLWQSNYSFYLFIYEIIK